MSAEVIPEFGSPKEHFCVLADMLEVAMDIIKVPELPHQADIRLVYMSSLVDGWMDGWVDGLMLSDSYYL